MPSSPFRIDPQDWTTLWQSELAAMAADRELAEMLATGAEAWNGILAWAGQQGRDDSATAAFSRPPAGSADGLARPDAPPRPASAGAIPGAGKPKRATSRKRKQPGEPRPDR